MADLPHFTLPMRVERGRFVVAEQDSAEDVASCVRAVLSCPRGHRPELPDFGIDDPTFSQGAPEAEPIADRLAEWEPRAPVDVTSQISDADELISNVVVALRARSEG